MKFERSLVMKRKLMPPWIVCFCFVQIMSLITFVVGARRMKPRALLAKFCCVLRPSKVREAPVDPACSRAMRVNPNVNVLINDGLITVVNSAEIPFELFSSLAADGWPGN